MGRWVDMDDHKDAQGFTDWASYRRAQRANGEVCATCPAMTLFPRYEGPQQCGQCRTLASDRGEATHESRLRCPKCRHAWEPEELLDEGDETAVQCPSCEHDFAVSVVYQPRYTSPPLLAEEADGAGEEDEEESEAGDE